jgi:hypothetical protein
MIMRKRPKPAREEGPSSMRRMVRQTIAVRREKIHALASQNK